MGGRRTALLIATDTYRDDTFSKLHAPTNDLSALAEVLSDPDIGRFTVQTMLNEPAQQVRIEINRLFANAERDDLLLLYVSGHGIKDASGHLHFAASDTIHDLLAATAVTAEFVRDRADQSRARRVLLWLDCCYAGAFPPGRIPKAAGEVDVLAQLDAASGRGCLVMTAATHVQYAYESGGSGRLTGSSEQSMFTSAILEGLRTGAADLDADGWIDEAELFKYVAEHMRTSAPSQTPTHNSQSAGDIYIALSKRGPRLPAGLEIEFRQALRSKYASIRASAIGELADRARNGDPIADEALRVLAAGDDRELVESALAPPAPVLEPDPVQDALPEPRSAGFSLPASLPKVRTSEAVTRVGVLLATLVVLLQSWKGWAAEPDSATNDVLRVLASAVALVVAVEAVFAWRRRRRDTSVILHRGRPRGLGEAGFSPDNRLLVIRTHVWLTEDWSRLPRDESTFGGVAFTPDGTTVLVGSPDGAAVLELPSQERRSTFGSGRVDHVAISADGRRVVTVDSGAGVAVVHDRSGGQLTTVRVHWCRSASLSPDGAHLSLLNNSRFSVWAVDSRRQVLSVLAEGSPYCAAFSSDGRLYATADLRRVITLYDTATWEVARELTGHRDPVNAVAFSHDGRFMASGGWDRTIRVWSTDSWTTVRTLEGHRDCVTSIAFSAEDQVLASTGLDGTLRLWDVSTGRLR
jgi:caspase domain-containing protein/WD40 domain-containing protein